MQIKAKILVHKTKEGFTGMVLGGILYRVGPGLVPQLFQDDATLEWINRSVHGWSYPDFETIDCFELKDVTVTIE